MNSETEIGFERRACTQARNIRIAERTQIHSKGAVSRRSPRKMKSTNQTQFIPMNQRREADSKPIQTQSWAAKPIWGRGGGSPGGTGR